jgi:hypothetical protein
LRSACRTLGRDDGGLACTACPLRDLCDLIERRLKTPQPPC